MVRRRYRARFATINAPQIDGNVDFILDMGVLEEPPVVQGSTVHPLRGSTEMQPFRIRGVDVDGSLGGSFVVDGRNRAIGRLLDVQWNDEVVDYYGEAGWVTYGVGRCSEFGQPRGPGEYEAEVSDESWKIRNRRLLFEHNDTTQLWPAGRRYRWRGFPAAWTADGERISQDGNTYLIKMTAGGPTPVGSGIGGAKYQGREISQALISFIRKNALPLDQVFFGGAVTRGNFNHIRVNYAGTDYQVVSFGSTLTETLEEPLIELPQSEFRTVTVWAVIYSTSEPPETGEAFIWAPTHPPEPGFPLHLGVDSATHLWGNDGGWLHKVELTRRAWGIAGIVYNAADMAALEADKSFTVIAPRVEEVPKDPERWLEDRIWSSDFLFAGPDLEGKRTLIDLRPPRFIPANVPVLDQTNCQIGPWSHRGDEMRNSFRWKFLGLAEPEEIGTPRPLILGQPNTISTFGPGIIFEPSPNQTIGLDNLVASEYESEAYEGPEEESTIGDSGRRPHVLDQTAALDPKDRNVVRIASLIAADRGAQVDETVAFLDPALLATFQDGPARGRLTVSRRIAESVRVGQIVWINNTALGLKLGQSLGGALPPGVGPQNPTDPGEIPDPEPSPTLGTPVLNADLSITAPVTNVALGQTARVEYITGAYLVAPDDDAQGWISATPLLTAPGDTSIPVRPRGTLTWIRVSGEVNGVRVTEYSTPVSVVAPLQPAFTEARLHLAEDGTPTVFWGVTDITLGVRILWEVHAAGAVPTYPGQQDFDPSVDLSFQIPDVPAVEEVITVRFEAYPEWEESPGEVGGTLGQVVVRSLQRPFPAVSLPIDLESEVEGVLPVANGGTGISSLVGHALKLLRVNAAATAYELWTLLVNLATQVTGVLGVSNGGTGLSAPGASGNVLTSNGTVWTSAAPASGGAAAVARVSETSMQNATTTPTAISWDTEDTDDDGYFDSGSPTKFIVPTGYAGWHLVGVVASSSNTTSVIRISLVLHVNGSPIGASAYETKDSAQSLAAQPRISWPVYLADGDEVEAVLSANTTVTMGANNQFWIARLGS
jgi:hypothetical protein